MRVVAWWLCLVLILEFSTVLCVQNIPEWPLCIGHRIGQDPENDSCVGCGKVEEQRVLYMENALILSFGTLVSIYKSSQCRLSCKQPGFKILAGGLMWISTSVSGSPTQL